MWSRELDMYSTMLAACHTATAGTGMVLAWRRCSTQSSDFERLCATAGRLQPNGEGSGNEKRLVVYFVSGNVQQRSDDIEPGRSAIVFCSGRPSSCSSDSSAPTWWKDFLLHRPYLPWVHYSPWAVCGAAEMSSVLHRKLVSASSRWKSFYLSALFL